MNLETGPGLKDFTIIEEIGKGAFGYVYKVKRIKDGEIYALKKVIMSKLKQKEKENTLNEVRILASINHNNVISYKEAFYDMNSFSICIVMECADNGDLEKKISNCIKNKTFLTESEIISYLTQILQGLKALHDKKIMHRDIKAANIFLFKSNLVKIGDLNVSKVVKMELVHTQTGTPYYASPEVWRDRPYDYKSDIWSLGCLLYEMTTLKAPFRGTTMKGVYEKVIKGIYDPIPTSYSKALANIINLMLQIKPQSRPNCDKLLMLIQEKMKHLNLNNQFAPLLKAPLLYLSEDAKPNSSQETKQSHSRLLKTIKIPRRLLDLNTVLPKNKYKKRVKSAFMMRAPPINTSDGNIYRPISSNEIVHTEMNCKPFSNTPINEKSIHDLSAIYQRNNNKMMKYILNESNEKEKNALINNNLKTEISEDPVLRLINKPILLKKNMFNKINNEFRSNSTPYKNNNINTKNINIIQKRIADLKNNYHYNNLNTNVVTEEMQPIQPPKPNLRLLPPRIPNLNKPNTAAINKLTDIVTSAKERATSALTKHDRNNSSNIKMIFNHETSIAPEDKQLDYVYSCKNIRERTDKSIILQDVSYLPTIENEKKKIFNIFNNNSSAVKISNTPINSKYINIKNMNLYPIKQDKDRYGFELKDFNSNIENYQPKNYVKQCLPLP